MKKLWNCATAALLFVIGVTPLAHATIWEVNCNGLGPGGDTTLTNTNGGAPSANFGKEPGGLTGTGNATSAPDALGALLGTPSQVTESGIATLFGVTLSAGDTVEITGICTQPVELRTSGVTVTGHTGNIAVAQTPPGSTPSDGDANQFIVSGALGIILNNLLFGSTTDGAVTFIGGYSFAGASLLTVVNAAQVVVENSEIDESPTRGIFVTQNSAVQLESSLVLFSGGTTGDNTLDMGIFATDNSSLVVGNGVSNGGSSNTFPSTISNNGGDGIRLANGSSLSFLSGTVSGNLLKQLFAVSSSSMILNGNNAFSANGNVPLVSVIAPSGDTDIAVALQTGSTLLAENQVAITGGTGGMTIEAAGSGTVTLEGSFISGGATTIEVTGGSLLNLAGGNYICNGTLATSTATPGCTASTGATDFAIEVDHVGALYDVGAISGFNFTAQADTITGAGALQLQSTADLGQGQISGQPSLVWTTGANGISVSQNSSLRLEGGVTITGAIGLAQGSNGFVNSSKAAGVHNTNVVTGGISCPFTTVPASHLQLANNSLATSTPPTVVATSFAGATSPQCLPF